MVCARLALIAFFAVKLIPRHHGRAADVRVDIHSEGRDQQLTRRPLTIELRKLFNGSNGSWRDSFPSGVESHLACVDQSEPVSTSIGHAVTGTYYFANWLELRLSAYVYADNAAAHAALSGLETGGWNCAGQPALPAVCAAGATP